MPFTSFQFDLECFFTLSNIITNILSNENYFTNTKYFINPLYFGVQATGMQQQPVKNIINLQFK